MAEYVLNGIPNKHQWARLPERLNIELNKKEQRFDLQEYHFSDLDSLSQQIELISNANVDVDLKETLTIFCHGERNGLVLRNSGEEIIKWQDLAQLLLTLKKRKPNLIFVLAVCESSKIGSLPSIEKSIFTFSFEVPMANAYLTTAYIIREYHERQEVNLTELGRDADEFLKRWCKLVVLR
jgi:hypothetical protein